MWLFILKQRPKVTSLEDLLIIVVPSSNAKTEGEAIDRFLGTHEDLNDPQFITERYEFLDILLFVLEETDNLSPNASALWHMMENNDNERDLLLDPQFRDRVRALMITDPETGSFGAHPSVFRLYNDTSGRERNSFRRTNELIKLNETRKLKFLWEDYCSELRKDYTLEELHGMARALGIQNPKRNKGWLCTEIGTRLVVTKTGLHAEQVQQLLKGPGFTEEDC